MVYELMKCNELAPLLFNLPLDWVITPQQKSMAPYYISAPKESGMLITLILKSLPPTQKIYEYNGLEVTGGTVRVQVNQEETKLTSQSRIGQDIPNGMGQSKFESVEENKHI
jgi:hypothetical protein